MWRIDEADCVRAMDAMSPMSVDSIVTDPPYELGFMGKAWDDTGITYQVEMWAACLRVLKPGGYLLAFGGSRTYHRMACAVEDAGFEIRDQIMWLYGSGFPKSLNLKGEHEGWGTALKPAHEPIVVARKPLIGTVAANVLKHGTGAVNVDGCRIEGEPWKAHDATGLASVKFFTDGDAAVIHKSPHQQGRWPANVILDEDAGAMLDEQSGERGGGAAQLVRRSGMGFHGGSGTSDGERVDYPAGGGASRFFYCPKAGRKEREAGCEALSAVQRDVGRKEGNPGGDNLRNRGVQKRHNHHPTVKPVALMRYLVRLVTPPGGTVLDPFLGSGTTILACLGGGFDCIGIEREPDYVAIARARIVHWEKTHGQETLDI